MIDQRDPLERLRAVNPVREDDVAGMGSSDAARSLFVRITAGPASDPSPRRPPAARRRRLVAAFAVATLCFGAVAYAIVNRQVSQPEAAFCFASVDLNAATEVVRRPERGALAACADRWAEGAFGATAVPTLVECVLESGAAGVFPSGPGRDPCRELNLSPVASWPPTTTSQSPGTPPVDPNAAFAMFQEAVVERFLATSCVRPDEGRVVVRQELDRAGLGGWTVRDTAAYTTDRPCAALGFDPPQQQVLLIPVPPRR